MVLIAVRGDKSIGLDRGSCGYVGCQEFDKLEKKLGKDFIGPPAFSDLGISLGSAAKQ